MDMKTLEQVHRRLLDKAVDMDAEIDKHRSGELQDDAMYGRLVYKQAGVMSCVLAINSMMSEAFQAGRVSKEEDEEEDDMSEHVRQLVNMGR